MIIKEIRLRATEKQREEFEEIAEAHGVPMSRIIREAVPIYYLEILPMVYRCLLTGADPKVEMQRFRERHPELVLTPQMAELSRQR